MKLKIYNITKWRCKLEINQNWKTWLIFNILNCWSWVKLEIHNLTSYIWMIENVPGWKITLFFNNLKNELWQCFIMLSNALAKLGNAWWIFGQDRILPIWNEFIFILVEMQSYKCSSNTSLYLKSKLTLSNDYFVIFKAFWSKVHF